MQALKAKFEEIEVESYKDVLYDNATEEWYMPYDPEEIEREERNSLIIALQFFNYMAKYREAFLTYTALTLHEQNGRYNKVEEGYLQHRLLRHKIGIYLGSYQKYILLESKLLDENDDDDDGGAQQDDTQLGSWATWLKDYTVSRAWEGSRDDLLEVIKSFMIRKTTRPTSEVHTTSN